MATLPTVDQRRLVTYKPSEEEPRSEDSLLMQEKFAGRLAILSVIVMLLCLVFIFFQGLSMLTWSYWRSEFVPLVPWHVIFIIGAASIVVMIVGFVVEHYTRDALLLNYWYVPQGMIIEKNSRNGGDYPLRWVVTIKGFNSRGEIRSYEHDVKAGPWHDEYKVGGYVDFRDDEDRENSLTEPLPEADIRVEH